MANEYFLTGCFITIFAMLTLPIFILRKEQLKCSKREKELKKHSLKLLINGWFLVIGDDLDSEKYLKKMVKNSGCIPHLCIQNLLNTVFNEDRQKIQNWTERDDFSGLFVDHTPFYLNAALLKKTYVDYNESLEETRMRLLKSNIDQEKLSSSSSSGSDSDSDYASSPGSIGCDSD